MSESETKKYPYENSTGETVWACCESSIGPVCGHKAIHGGEEKRHKVPTYSYTCTAYVRTTLRRALEFQGKDNVWAGAEYVNAAKAMCGNQTWENFLPDKETWSLTKLELMTIKSALEWRRAKRSEGKWDDRVSHSTWCEWGRIEAEINRVLREIMHSEGKYWM